MENKVQIKQLSGMLNLDDPHKAVAPASHVGARNIYFTGTPPNREANVVQGVLAINNSLLPGTGVNKTIFRKYDQVNKRVYFGNYNSLGGHGIYSFDTITQTFSRLIEVGVNTSVDPLAFSAESIYNTDIIYGDSTQGDILYFTDSLSRPTKININRALTGGYGTIQRSYLDVAKEPADMIVYATYEDDPSSTVNGLRKKLFRFKIRWVFDDLDKSITSSQSEMPLPFNAFDQATDTDPTKNCRIALVYQTGPSNVRRVEIYAANSDGNQMSDFYLIESVDKTVQGVSSNDIATYLFYNDKAYTTLNTTESNQLLDYVPQQSIAQTTLNGNVIAYANITEGYPNLTNFSDGTNTSTISPSGVPYYYGNYYSQLVAYKGASSIHVVVRGTVILPSNNYNVYFSDNSNISYASVLGDDAASVIEGLRVDSIANGFTIDGVSSNDLYISKTGVDLSFWNITNSSYAFNALLNTSFNAYDWNSKYGFGLVYFDQKGRTNGVVYTNGFSVQSNSYTESNPTGDITKFNASIYHQPPDWAYYYQWVRTKNLNKANLVQWITDRTYKDLSVVVGIVKYAYLSIESLRQFVVNNQGSPLAYSFTSGDRVRFFKRYNGDGSTANIYGSAKDFEVVGSLINPTINGEVKSGQFVKIVLPSTDGNFDFGPSGFDNYFIELYTPAQPIASNLNLYYEFGERYSIGDPTISSRYHHGGLQDQVNFVQPATFEFYKGDDYVRLRAIQTGNIYSWNIPSTNANGFRFLFPLNFISSTYTDANLTPHSVSYAGVGNAFNPSTDNRWMLQVGASVTLLKVGGVITLNFPTARSGDSWIIYAANKSNDNYVLAGPFDASNAGTYTFPISLVDFNGSIGDSISLENDNLFLLLECVNNSNDRQVNILASTFNLTVDRVINQRCIDPNFSDYYASAVNSNGRAWVFDENANRITYPTQIRWSLPYQQDTQINMTSRFYPENFDTLDRSNGPIRAMRSNIGVLTYFQDRRCGWTRVYGKYITDSEASGQLATTDSIISANNTTYYDGNYGVGNQATSIVQSGYVYYFVDPIRRKILRLSRDGITDLSETYKVQTWASQNIAKYLNPGTYRFGGAQKILGTFNIRQDNMGEYLLMAQGTASVSGETMPFEEKYNMFTAPLDIDCDAIVCAEDVLYAFRNGVLYKQGGVNNSAVFFGTQYQANIKLSYNDQVAVKKIFNATGHMSNATWVSDTKGDVATNHVNPQTLTGQESLIMVQDYDVSENPKRYAAINKDMNSMTDGSMALWEGDFMVGEYLVVTYKYGSNVPSAFYAPFITWQNDNRNP